MAPSNLSQVFIANDISDTTNGTLETGSTFYTTAAAVANTLIGVWDMGTAAYLTTALTSAKGPLQIVQTPLAGKNTLASPLFEAKDIKYIKYTPYLASVKHKVALDVGTLTGTSADDAIMVRLALRTAPTDYLSFSSPNDTALDLSSGGYVFPLVGNFAAGRMIFNVEIPETGSDGHANTEATFYTKLAAAIAANKTLNAIFKCTDNTTTIDIEARHVGVIFDITVQYSDGRALADTQSITGWEAGSGNYWQVLGDEKKQRAKYGNFNRMYFPQDFTQYAISGNTYDCVEVGYLHGHPADTGIARAGEMNVVKMYHKVAVAANTLADAVFGGYTVGTGTYFTY
jgi:hypothetical protein